MHHPAIQSKLPHVGTSIFTVMSSLAQQHGALNLGQGFPDLPVDERLTAAVTLAMQNGQNQYIHANGLPLLTHTIADKIDRIYQVRIEAEKEITITPGGTYAIFTALATIIQPGDEVIVFEPAYDCYIPAIEVNGGKAVTVELTYPEYSIDWNVVQQKLNSRTKAIIVNSPHNPTGAVLGQGDLNALKSIIKNTGIFIIADEVYEHLIFDGKQHLSFLADDELYSRSFVCFSLGKVYNCTGWKTGYCVAPAPLTKEFRKIHQYNCFSVFGPGQHGFAAVLQQPDSYENLSSDLQQKRDFFAAAMQQTRFTSLPTYGSYFQLYSFAQISREAEHAFAERVVKEAGVACIPVSAFYTKGTQNQVVRFCFAKKEETLLAAAQKLAIL